MIKVSYFVCEKESRKGKDLVKQEYFRLATQLGLIDIFCK